MRVGPEGISPVDIHLTEVEFSGVRLFFKCCLILPNSAIVKDDKSYVDSYGKENKSLWKIAVPHPTIALFGLVLKLWLF